MTELCGLVRAAVRAARTAHRSRGLATTALLAALTPSHALPAQGAILDRLDGETLYHGGFLLTLGHDLQRREVLRTGSRRTPDPLASHELEQTTSLALQYGLRHDLQLGIALHHVRTERNGTGPDQEAGGLGDLELFAKWRFLRLDAPHVATNFAVLGGVSLPTGADDERSAGVELEPELQPGTGGIDPMLGVAVTHEPRRWRFNAAAMYRHHTDSDGDGDRPGDSFLAELAVGNRFWLEPYPGPFMRLDLVARLHWEDHDRMDGELPDTGGERITAGINWAFRPRPALDLQVYLERPVWQDVNGTQLGHDWTLDVTVGYRF
jgi:hypothetical protein